VGTKKRLFLKKERGLNRKKKGSTGDRGRFESEKVGGGPKGGAVESCSQSHLCKGKGWGRKEESRGMKKGGSVNKQRGLVKESSQGETEVRPGATIRASTCERGGWDRLCCRGEPVLLKKRRRAEALRKNRRLRHLVYGGGQLRSAGQGHYETRIKMGVCQSPYKTTQRKEKKETHTKKL